MTEKDKPTWKMFLVALAGLVLAIAFFGLRMMKTDGGRDAVLNTVDPARAQRMAAESANAEAFQASIASAKKISEAERSCGVPLKPETKGLDEFFEARARGNWPKYTIEQAKCLAEKGVIRNAGDFVGDAPTTRDATTVAAPPPNVRVN